MVSDIALSACRFTSLLLAYNHFCNNLFIHSIFAPAILRKDAITCRACRPTAKKTTRSGRGCTEGLVSRKPATYDIQSRFALLHKTTRLACSKALPTPSLPRNFDQWYWAKIRWLRASFLGTPPLSKHSKNIISCSSFANLMPS
jgi:hypothetical protein